MSPSDSDSQLLSLVEQSIDVRSVEDEQELLFTTPSYVGNTTKHGKGSNMAPPFKGNLIKLAAKDGLLVAKLKYWINTKLDTLKVMSTDKSYDSVVVPKPLPGQPLSQPLPVPPPSPLLIWSFLPSIVFQFFL